MYNLGAANELFCKTLRLFLRVNNAILMQKRIAVLSAIAKDSQCKDIGTGKMPVLQRISVGQAFPPTSMSPLDSIYNPNQSPLQTVEHQVNLALLIVVK
ncbi:MAG: hypothetical protein KME26_21210 [Oscillatoria princeps RMCB-10]|jgi:hypothetical protein|nr:hypothetical protein [Oscillatoria princeps RMCB-10]